MKKAFFTVIVFFTLADVWGQSAEAKKAFDQGMASARAGNVNAGITGLTKAIQLYPNYKEAYCWRGILYNGLQEYDRAIADFTQSIKIDTNYEDGYFCRAVAYESYKKDFVRAKADYEATLRINPNNNDARTALNRVNSQLAISQPAYPSTPPSNSGSAGNTGDRTQQICPLCHGNKRCNYRNMYGVSYDYCQGGYTGCGNCSAKGIVNGRTCTACNGSTRVKCSICKGTGICSRCGGTGYI